MLAQWSLLGTTGIVLSIARIALELITNVFRSLVTTLRSAEHFELAHLLSPQIAPLVDAAKYFYVEGYFLTHGLESVLHLAKKSSESGKVNIYFAAITIRLMPYSVKQK